MGVHRLRRYMEGRMWFFGGVSIYPLPRPRSSDTPLPKEWGRSEG